MTKGLRVFILGVLLFISCSKDELDGEYEVLIGEWEWIYTEYKPNAFDKYVITPESQGFTYSMIFKEKGVLIHYIDGCKDYRTKIKQIDTFDFQSGSIRLNLKEQRWGKGQIGLIVFDNDSLFGTKYPVVEFEGVSSDGDGVSEFKHFYARR